LHVEDMPDFSWLELLYFSPVVGEVCIFDHTA
jgi:hypothetical protein